MRRHRVRVRGSQETACPTGWKESLKGKSWELTICFRVTCWRKLAEAANECLDKGQQVFVKGELRGDDSQNPRIWQGNDAPAGRRQHRSSYEVTAHTVKFLTHQLWAASREGNRGAPIGEPSPGEEDDDLLPF